VSISPGAIGIDADADAAEIGRHFSSSVTPMPRLLGGIGHARERVHARARDRGDVHTEPLAAFNSSIQPRAS